MKIGKTPLAQIALGLLLLLGLAPRGHVLLHPPETLISLTQDDAFYYFQVARHVIAGQGSTFDGLNPTNGYHPLWMLLMLPGAALCTDPWTYTRLMLALALLCTLLSSVLVFAILRKALCPFPIALLGVVLYFFNPAVAKNAFNGLETSLSTLAFLLVLYLAVSEIHNGKARRGWSVLFGLALALLFLARTDNAFFILAFLPLAVFREEGWRAQLRRAAVVAGVMALAAGPWLLWNLARFGSVVQGSGLAGPYAVRELFRSEGHTSADVLRRSVEEFRRYFFVDIYRHGFGMPRWVFLAGALFAAGVFAAKWRGLGRSGARAARRMIAALLALAAGALLLIFAHTFVRWYPRDYYFESIIPLWSIAFSLSLGLLAPAKTVRSIAPPGRSLRGAAAAIAAAFFAAAALPLSLYDWRVLEKPRYPHHLELLHAAQWLQANTRPDNAAAAFNAGIIAFFSARTVVNVDGVINNAAFDAIRQRRLYAYMRRSRVVYLVDYLPIMLERYRPFLGPADAPRMTLLRDFEQRGCNLGHSPVRAYRLDWTSPTGQ